jgi:hypothetical protein
VLPGLVAVAALCAAVELFPVPAPANCVAAAGAENVSDIWNCTGKGQPPPADELPTAAVELPAPSLAEARVTPLTPSTCRSWTIVRATLDWEAAQPDS